MKVIFVASGNKTGGQISPFVKSQYESLQAAGLDMRLLPVNGHGAWAYLKAAWKLRKLVRKEKPDVIHAHYSVCGHVAVLATLGMIHRPKIMVSILGSFPKRNRKWRLVRFCIQHVWDKTLVKSKRTMTQLGIELPIVPNGVNLGNFHPMDHVQARNAVGFEKDKKYVIWCSHPTRPEKNFELAKASVALLNDGMSRDKSLNEPLSLNDVELVAVYDKKPSEVATYMNAADCLLLTSWSEGSPNVIKEAMACNCPIVTTDVGDVNERLEGLKGCYVAKTEHPITNQHTQDTYMDENADKVAECLRIVLAFGNRTEGRKRLQDDGLTVELTADKIVKLYLAK